MGRRPATFIFIPHVTQKSLLGGNREFIPALLLVFEADVIRVSVQECHAAAPTIQSSSHFKMSMVVPEERNVGEDLYVAVFFGPDTQKGEMIRPMRESILLNPDRDSA